MPIDIPADISSSDVFTSPTTIYITKANNIRMMVYPHTYDGHLKNSFMIYRKVCILP